jgi:hypothetical protein
LKRVYRLRKPLRCASPESINGSRLLRSIPIQAVVQPSVLRAFSMSRSRIAYSFLGDL